jgi:hypothetical protein
MLEDKVANTLFDVRTQETYDFHVSPENIDALATRFRIVFGGVSGLVNTQLNAIGATACQDSGTAFVTVENSQQGVQYSARWEGLSVGDVVEGNGGIVQIPITLASLPAGQAELTIFASMGTCSSAILTSKPVVNRVATGEITSVNNAVVCNEGSASLAAAGAPDSGWYNWYESQDGEALSGQNGAVYVTPSLTKTKTYFVAAVNALGCEGERIPVVAEVSQLEEPVLSVEGMTLVSNFELGNKWYLNGQLLEGEENNTITVTASGMYTLEVTRGACSTSVSREMFVTGVAEIGADQRIIIYPNPTAGKVFVVVRTGNNSVGATLVNSMGAAMEYKPLEEHGGIKQGEFELRQYPSGIYYILVRDGANVYTHKIAKVE